MTITSTRETTDAVIEACAKIAADYPECECGCGEAIAEKIRASRIIELEGKQ